jgi:hypothetical protein
LDRKVRINRLHKQKLVQFDQNLWIGLNGLDKNLPYQGLQSIKTKLGRNGQRNHLDAQSSSQFDLLYDACGGPRQRRDRD